MAEAVLANSTAANSYKHRQYQTFIVTPDTQGFMHKMTDRKTSLMLTMLSIAYTCVARHCTELTLHRLTFVNSSSTIAPSSRSLCGILHGTHTHTRNT